MALTGASIVGGRGSNAGLHSLDFLLISEDGERRVRDDGSWVFCSFLCQIYAQAQVKEKGVPAVS